jgi:hypothetical protein
MLFILVPLMSKLRILKEVQNLKLHFLFSFQIGAVLQALPLLVEGEQPLGPISMTANKKLPSCFNLG